MDKKLDKKKYFPMLVQRGVKIDIWKIFKALPKDLSKKLNSDEMVELIFNFEKKYLLQDTQTEQISRLIQRLFFGEISEEGFVQEINGLVNNEERGTRNIDPRSGSRMTQGGVGGQLLAQIKNLKVISDTEREGVDSRLRGNGMEKGPTDPRSESRMTKVEMAQNTQKMSLDEVLKAYPQIANQKITSDIIITKPFLHPLAPTVGNWLKVYDRLIGVAKQTGVVRGDFLYRSAVCRGLRENERMQLAELLHARDDSTYLLRVDTDRGKILWTLPHKMQSARNKTTTQPSRGSTWRDREQHVSPTANKKITPHKTSQSTPPKEREIQNAKIIKPQPKPTALKRNHVVTEAPQKEVATTFRKSTSGAVQNANRMTHNNLQGNGNSPRKKGGLHNESRQTNTLPLAEEAHHNFNQKNEYTPETSTRNTISKDLHFTQNELQPKRNITTLEKKSITAQEHLGQKPLMKTSLETADFSNQNQSTLTEERSRIATKKSTHKPLVHRNLSPEVQTKNEAENSIKSLGSLQGKETRNDRISPQHFSRIKKEELRKKNKEQERENRASRPESRMTQERHNGPPVSARNKAVSTSQRQSSGDRLPEMLHTTLQAGVAVPPREDKAGTPRNTNPKTKLPTPQSRMEKTASPSMTAKQKIDQLVRAEMPYNRIKKEELEKKNRKENRDSRPESKVARGASADQKAQLKSQAANISFSSGHTMPMEKKLSKKRTRSAYHIKPMGRGN